MRWLARFILLLVVAVPAVDPVMAHDPGFNAASLTQLPDGLYRLAVTAPREYAHYFAAPDLPARCRLEDHSSEPVDPRVIVFAFRCEPDLSVDDAIVLRWQRDGVLLTSRRRGSAAMTAFYAATGAAIVLPASILQGRSVGASRSTWAYTALGVEHILSGVDHLLFVATLFFLVSGFWTLVKTITAFTVAHSLTLALAVVWSIGLPAAPVEACIAFSIVVAAAQIVRQRDRSGPVPSSSVWLMAFLFGLVHGAGFAGGLLSLGLPEADIPGVLLFFNAGVEVGQLLFLVALAGFYAALRYIAPSSSRFVPVASAYGVGCAAMYWFFERLAAIAL